jgi:hypothetical protein
VDRTSPDTLPADERESLTQWLDYHRATLLMKCDGLAPEDLDRASCPPSTLTLLGLVRHLVGVEHWFHSFDGAAPEPDPTPEDASAVVDEAEVARAFAAYRAAVERSRRAASGRSLDEVVDLPHWVADDQPKQRRPTSLRWVHQHLIEEYARHNGHADLIRERIDGAVGD